MAIRIIKHDEKNTVVIDNATFTYRRVASFEQRKIEMTHTKKGVEDKRAIIDSVLQYAITDWAGIEDEHGGAVPFSADLVKYLPEEAKAALIEHLYANDPAKAALGNSNGF